MTDTDELHDGCCIHGMKSDSCSLCNSPVVFITAGGDCYHSRRDCEALAAGQLRNLELGRSNASIEETRRGSASALFRRACSVCIGGSKRTEFSGNSRALDGASSSKSAAETAFERFRRKVLEHLAERGPSHPSDGELAVWFHSGLTSYQTARSIVKGLTPTQAQSGLWSKP